MLTDPWPVNSSMTDAKELRLGLTGVILTPGVVPFSKPGDNAPMPALVYASSTMTPALRDFTVVTARANSTSFATDGFSAMRNVGTTGVPAVGTAPATGSRIDTLVTRANDNTQGDGTSVPAILIRAGQATTGTPAPPTLQPGDTEIAQILVPAGATALNSSGVVITHTYRSATIVGGPRYVRNATERAALLTDTLYPLGLGQVVYQQDNGYRYDTRMNAAGTAQKLYRTTGGVMHLARTVNFNIGNATLTGVASTNTQSSDSINGDYALVTDTINGAIKLDEGIYTINVVIVLSSRPNNQRAFVEIDDGASGGSTVLSRGSTRDDDKLSSTVTLMVPEGGRYVNLNCYQSTGGTITGTSDVFITRHAA